MPGGTRHAAHPAEIARTLAAGRLPGIAHVAYRPGPYQVRHVTDRARPGAAAVPRAAAARRRAAPARTATTPRSCWTSLTCRRWPARPRWAGSGCPAGPPRCSGDEARARRPGLRRRRPGRRPARRRRLPGRCTGWRSPRSATSATASLVEIDPDDVRRGRARTRCTPIEFDLIADLADHHVAEMTDYVRRQLGLAAPAPATQPRVVRIDRYGFLVRSATGWPGWPSRARSRTGTTWPTCCTRCLPH